MGNDISMNISDVIAKSQADRRANIAKNFTNASDVLPQQIVKAESDTTEDDIVKSIIENEEVEEVIIKAAEEVDENPFEKAAEDDTQGDIEKSDIFHAMNSGNNITFKKSGKEVKESITTKVLPGLNSQLAVKQTEADTLLSVCGTAPLKAADYWWTSELNIDVPYKVYNWEETYFDSESKNTSVVSSLSLEQAETNKALAKNYPANKEQGENRRKYNDKVREICEIMVDVKACEILGAINDDASIDLTPKQIIAFQL